jgi:lysophospholipase L1-like esterase
MNPKSPYYAGFNEKAAEVNKLLDAGKERYSYVYLDIASLVSDGNGDLKDECTCDGIHLSATGYFIWSAELAKGLRMMQNLDPTEMLFENN